MRRKRRNSETQQDGRQTRSRGEVTLCTQQHKYRACVLCKCRPAWLAPAGKVQPKLLFSFFPHMFFFLLLLLLPRRKMDFSASRASSHALLSLFPIESPSRVSRSLSLPLPLSLSYPGPSLRRPSPSLHGEDAL